jgi:hypothetical protein
LGQQALVIDALIQRLAAQGPEGAGAGLRRCAIHGIAPQLRHEIRACKQARCGEERRSGGDGGEVSQKGGPMHERCVKAMPKMKLRGEDVESER